jgi:hypothetical protein
MLWLEQRGSKVEQVIVCTSPRNIKRKKHQKTCGWPRNRLCRTKPTRDLCEISMRQYFNASISAKSTPTCVAARSQRDLAVAQPVGRWPRQQALPNEANGRFSCHFNAAVMILGLDLWPASSTLGCCWWRFCDRGRQMARVFFERRGGHARATKTEKAPLSVQNPIIFEYST